MSDDNLDVTAKDDEFELSETEGTESGGAVWPSFLICPTSACTSVRSACPWSSQ